jgi:glutathione S-transferase
MQLRLYDWKPSPFCLKVRSILDYKGLAYTSINPLGKPILELRKRTVGKVPVLDIDGQLVADSTVIALELERLAPTPPIVPAERRARAQCHVYEDWADESLYFVGLYLQWIEPEGAKKVPRAFGTSVVGKIGYSYFSRLIARQLRGQGTARKPLAMIRDDLARHLDACDGLVEARGFLLGDAPLLCDFAVAAQLVYLARTPVGGAAIAGRPVEAYLARMKALRSSTSAAS